MHFSGERLRVARQRRKLTGKELAKKSGLTSVTVSKAENGHQVEEDTARALASALGFPFEFFWLEPPQVINAESVSFRSLSKMGAAERDAALAAGSLGVELYEWVEHRFNLPSPNLIDLNKERNRPDTAARLLRQHWGLGDRPIGNMLALLESNGVRVLSLSENTANVDAYSFWKADNPYIFLNQRKTPERSIFDSAHELGHLVMHHHAGAKNDKGAEYQADAFASAFLMPEADIKGQISGISTAAQVIRKKDRWRVSAMALAYRLHKLRLISDWVYRSICIDLGKQGYRSGEPVGVEREKSVVWEKVLIALWSERMTKADIANGLKIPLEELENFIFDLAGRSPSPFTGASLKLVV
ncbi:XRE family transcriptional regulator [Erythrobacter sp. KY5]|uniref:ImmA/IrrE family metallo-endopeptidase n=1 Tax=Erythrobacter sp. KY5 TaxID=2011159 RepID=UPI000DBF0987|nr:ImmA/IrrE family metallo-endopeptidase [Erythrobacter sp. KY5]AWW75168.1 XRE family transcriptional regulator [Erythrobacter sp. KY5]